MQDIIIKPVGSEAWINNNDLQIYKNMLKVISQKYNSISYFTLQYKESMTYKHVYVNKYMIYT